MDEYMMLESMNGKTIILHSGVSKLNGAKVGSGRYPLGSGKRPYQNAPEEKARKMTRRERRLAKKNKVTVEEKNELTEEEKKNIIDHGNIRKAYEYRDQLTNTDIDAVITRYEKEKRLGDLMPKKKNGMDYVKNIGNGLDTAAKALNGGINVWNASARVINTLNPSANLPIVQGGEKKKDKKD